MRELEKENFPKNEIVLDLHLTKNVVRYYKAQKTNKRKNNQEGLGGLQLIAENLSKS